MKIATYYEPLHKPREAEDRALIDLWRQSWEKRGFEPILVGWHDARQHPYFDSFFEKVHQFPTVNGKEYEEACFLRHLAFATCGARVFSDYDVINYSMHFNPDDIRFRAGIHSFFNGGPSLFTASSTGLGWIIDEISNWKHPEVISNRPHLSDQTVFLALPISRSSDMIDYCRPGWEQASVVHYSNQYFGECRKAERIQQVRPI